MRKSLFWIAAFGVFGLAFTSSPYAEEKVFAMVPKLIGHAFYADVERGCQDEAAKLGVKCLFSA